MSLLCLLKVYCLNKEKKKKSGDLLGQFGLLHNISIAHI